MPIVTREPITGLAHCAQQTIDGVLAFDGDGVPSGEERCPGYAQAEVAAVREVTATTFGDMNGATGDPIDQALAGNVSYTQERILWVDDADRACPFCGVERAVTDQVRPRYAALGGVRGNADQLFADRRARREQGASVLKTADAAERQAAALEEANRLKERELDLREAELDALPPRRAPKPPAKVPA